MTDEQYLRRLLVAIGQGARATRYFQVFFPRESKRAQQEAIAQGLIRITNPRHPLPKLTAKGRRWVTTG